MQLMNRSNNVSWGIHNLATRVGCETWETGQKATSASQNLKQIVLRLALCVILLHFLLNYLPQSAS